MARPKVSWEATAAKRIVAEDAVRQALANIEAARLTGGPRTHGKNTSYVIALHLLRHAAEQLRLSEGA